MLEEIVFVEGPDFFNRAVCFILIRISDAPNAIN